MKLREITSDPISVLEDISAAQGQLKITTTSWKDVSTPTSISTHFRRNPYKFSPHGTEPTYSILNYVHSDEVTKILSSLKGKGPYAYDDRQITHLLTGVIGACKKLMTDLDPDVILYPKSSSPLLKRFVDMLHKAYPKVMVTDEAFVKKMLKAEDEAGLLNTEHPDWKKFAEKYPDTVIELKKSIKRHIKDGVLELKHFYKQHAKFLKNFIEMKDASNTLDQVIEKRILVVDDILSSGSTMLEMFRQLREFEPESISGLTIFKRTSQKHD